MFEAIPILTALYAGLAGSGHCVGMCGGMAALAGSGPGRTAVQVPLFHLGRILAYAGAGALGALLFGASVGALPLGGLRTVAAVACAMVLMVLGLRFLLGQQGLGWLDRWGGGVWRRLAPFARRLLPVKTPAGALALGFVWGWLPCGLVYLMLPLAWSTGDPGQGALVMAAFGLATSPALLALGFGGAGVRVLLRRPSVRAAVGVAMIFSGAWFLAAPFGASHGAMHALGAGAYCTSPVFPQGGIGHD